jgi:hypothetical protein
MQIELDDKEFTKRMIFVGLIYFVFGLLIGLWILAILQQELKKYIARNNIRSYQELPPILQFTFRYVIDISSPELFQVTTTRVTQLFVSVPSGDIDQAISSLGLSDICNDPTVPNNLCCVIDSTLYRDPVINFAGHTYERKSLELWYRTNKSDPKTNINFTEQQTTFIVPNKSLERQIINFLHAKAAQKRNAGPVTQVQVPSPSTAQVRVPSLGEQATQQRRNRRPAGL